MVSTEQQVGEALRRIRRDHHLSLRHVAEQAGISVATLSRVETNKQSVDVGLLLSLANVLRVSLNEVLGDGDDGSGRGDGELDRATITRQLQKLPSADRARLLLQRSQREKPLQETMDDLITTLDLLRDELETVHRKVKSGKKQ